MPRAHSSRSTCRVQRNSSAALTELGVRVVKRSADLTITLVSDYLDDQLAELNRQHLSDRTRWLLVQPTGIFPLVGPVFQSRQERLLDLSRRAHETEPRGQGDARPRPCALCRGFAARREPPRAKRHRACSHRDREGDRDRLPYRIARPHHQPRSPRLDDREALRRSPPAMSRVRPKEVARPAPDRRCRSNLALAASCS